MFYDTRLPGRFWDKIEVRDGCWHWTASRSAQYGYIWWEGRGWRAHKLAYLILVGPIPEGLELDHLCTNPLCVNPDHLEPVTHRENVLRSNNMAGRNARKTHCKWGHEFTQENTYHPPKHPKKRYCRACMR